MIWIGIIHGELASKANSRQLVTIRGRPAFIKSKKARGYASDVAKQVRPLKPMLEGNLRFSAKIFYASQRPDLDASVLLDALQGLIYANDRQCREIHLYHFIDKQNPRAEVTVETI